MGFRDNLADTMIVSAHGALQNAPWAAVLMMIKEDIMFCTNCGKENSENSSFCTGCGNKLVQESLKTKLFGGAKNMFGKTKEFANKQANNVKEYASQHTGNADKANGGRNFKLHNKNRFPGYVCSLLGTDSNSIDLYAAMLVISSESGSLDVNILDSQFIVHDDSVRVEVNYKNDSADETFQMEISEESLEAAHEIKDRISECQAAHSDYEKFLSAKWGPISGAGNEHDFILDSEIIHINRERDVYNYYRNQYRRLSIAFAEKVNYEAMMQVYDLNSFCDTYPRLFMKYWDEALNRSLNIIIEKGIYDVSKEEISGKVTSFTQNFRNYYLALLENIEKTKEANAALNSAVFNLMTPRVDRVYASNSADLRKAAIKANVKNSLLDLTEGAIANATAKLNPKQQAEYYSQIDFAGIKNLIQVDYFNVHIALLQVLMQHGEKIWVPNKAEKENAKKVFLNISNPSFPQERKKEMFLQVFLTWPYDKQYQDYLIATWGNNNQTAAICSYFGE